MIHVRVIMQKSGKGLLKDLAIIDRLLKECQCNVVQYFFAARFDKKIKVLHWLERQVSRLPDFLQRCVGWLSLRFGELTTIRESVDVNIFLQSFLPGLLPSAKINILIPNQEWFRPGLVTWLRYIDLVLCKTREAERIFSGLGCRTEFMSFTSDDRYIKGINKDFSKALHFAAPGIKGTELILDSWKKHPEWPTLYVTSRSLRSHFVFPEAPNIVSLGTWLEDNKLKMIQNEVGFYIGLSEAEGFGHSHVEAMSCGSVVVTTDAPPMNELICSERGMLIASNRSQPLRLGRRYFCTREDFEQSMDTMLDLDDSQLLAMGKSARYWYLENDIYFRFKFKSIVEKLLQRVESQCSVANN